jgi:hypothetical protein
MTLQAFLGALQNSPVGLAISGNTGSGWWFPNIETIHVLAISLVFGSILMVDLRLLGLTGRDSAVSRLSGEILPYTWIAFAIAVVSGTLLFISKAQIYFYNLQFELKFLFMALAGLNMLVFHRGAYRRVLEWDNKLPPPPAARLAGALSIAFWVGVIFMGRWIGFKT